MSPITMPDPHHIQVNYPQDPQEIKSKDKPKEDPLPVGHQPVTDPATQKAAAERQAFIRAAEAELEDPTVAIGIQTAFSRMQMVQAKLCKQQSQNKVEEIQKIQEKQANVADMIHRFRLGRTHAPEEMDKSVYDQMKAMGLAVDPPNTTEGYRFEGGRWGGIIAALQTAWDNIEHGRCPNWNLDEDLAKKWIDDWLPKIREWQATGQPINLTKQGLENLDHAIQIIAPFTNTNISQNFHDKEKTPVDMVCQNKDQADYTLKSLTNYQEQIGTKTQTVMVALQDFLGQYNSYLQGASSALTEANRLLARLGSGQ